MSNDDVQQHLLELLDDANPAKALVGIFRCIRKQSLSNMLVQWPCVYLPVVGSKNILVGKEVISASSNELLVVPSGVKFQIDNIPNLTTKNYVGVVLEFDEQTLSLFHRMYNDNYHLWDLSPTWKHSADALHGALAEWLSWSSKNPVDIRQARHRLCEFLLLLAESDMAGHILTRGNVSMEQRLSQLLSSDIARDWKMSEVCRTMALSESTLRRRLESENVSFRHVLEDVRLLHGVWLILESGLAIGTIAVECGYQSQSRFSERFRRRFTMSPTELRNTLAT